MAVSRTSGIKKKKKEISFQPTEFDLFDVSHPELGVRVGTDQFADTYLYHYKRAYHDCRSILLLYRI